jgi:uncharacterized protein (DUF58 family)
VSVTTHPLSIRIAAWIAGRDGVEHGDVLLDRKRVYILPTRAGLLFAAAMLMLLVGAINYGLQLGFLLTFLVTSMAVIGMYHTHRNLARITLRGHHVDNVFAGDLASFQVSLSNPTAEARFALHLTFVLPARRRRRRLGSRERPLARVLVDQPANGAATAAIGLPTRRRGVRPCPRLRIETRFPFGLWIAWAYFTPPLTAVVYPTPEDNAPALPMVAGAAGDGISAVAGGEEFAGVRPYQAGDPQKRIAWRLAARSDALAVKLFETTAGTELVLDYAGLPAALTVEQKLSRLARWVLLADAAQLRYALRLPGGDAPADQGPTHRERCLKALALFPG